MCCKLDVTPLTINHDGRIALKLEKTYKDNMSNSLRVSVSPVTGKRIETQGHTSLLSLIILPPWQNISLFC